MVALKYPMLCGGLLAGAVMLAWAAPQAQAQYYPVYSYGWATSPVVVAPPPVVYAPPPVVVAPAPVYHAPAYVYHPRVIHRGFGFSFHHSRGGPRCYSGRSHRSFGFGFHYRH